MGDSLTYPIHGEKDFSMWENPRLGLLQQIYCRWKDKACHGKEQNILSREIFLSKVIEIQSLLTFESAKTLGKHNAAEAI